MMVILGVYDDDDHDDGGDDDDGFGSFGDGCDGQSNEKGCR